jgi:hypothetical protein
LRIPAGWSRREADITDRDSCGSGVDAREAHVDLTVDKFPLRRGPQPRLERPERG